MLKNSRCSHKVDATDVVMETAMSFKSEIDLRRHYHFVRSYTELICQPLETEDYVVQPAAEVSPPKWHLGHTTWFFETFILKPYGRHYSEFNPDFNYVFNSYYESVGARIVRTNRGNLSRPTVVDVYRYRKHVDRAMDQLLSHSLEEDICKIIQLGCQHEQQHQELLFSDIKYILGHNPLFPPYNRKGIETVMVTSVYEFISFDEGVYEIGYGGGGFSYDNELQRHKVYLPSFQIATGLVTNEIFLQFIHAGGYQNFRYWHAEGWEWVQINKVQAPLYWHLIEGEWHSYSLRGLERVAVQQPVTHINYFEAAALARWMGMRLPTEAEWEVAAPLLLWGQRWEWTESAYLPYPGFTTAEGALGEYNGKFMVNQMVLRGASVATPKGHSRISYRNFFQPSLRWQYTGIRLAK
jgi:ergothioneine biosynthesis protein EgtB